MENIDFKSEKFEEKLVGFIPKGDHLILTDIGTVQLAKTNQNL